MESTLHFLFEIFHSPIAGFTILLMITLIILPWFEGLRLPGLIGLLIAGVIFSSSGLGLLDPKSDNIPQAILQETAMVDVDRSLS